MGVWRLFEDELAPGDWARDDLPRVAAWLYEHRGAFCAMYENDVFRYGFRTVPVVTEEKVPMPARIIFVEREKDGKYFEGPPVGVDFNPNNPDIDETIVPHLTRQAIRKALDDIEREYDPHAYERPT